MLSICTAARLAPVLNLAFGSVAAEVALHVTSAVGMAWARGPIMARLFRAAILM
jgi:hypothetical protein